MIRNDDAAYFNEYMKREMRKGVQHRFTVQTLVHEKQQNQKDKEKHKGDSPFDLLGKIAVIVEEQTEKKGELGCYVKHKGEAKERIQIKAYNES